MISAPGGDSAARRTQFSLDGPLVTITVREVAIFAACSPVLRSCQMPAQPRQSLDMKRRRMVPAPPSARTRREAGRPAGSDPWMSRASPESRGGTDQPAGTRGRGWGLELVFGARIGSPAAPPLPVGKRMVVVALAPADLAGAVRVREAAVVDVPVPVIFLQGNDDVAGSHTSPVG